MQYLKSITECLVQKFTAVLLAQRQTGQMCFGLVPCKIETYPLDRRQDLLWSNSLHHQSGVKAQNHPRDPGIGGSDNRAAGSQSIQSDATDSVRKHLRIVQLQANHPMKQGAVLARRKRVSEAL